MTSFVVFLGLFVLVFCQDEMLDSNCDLKLQSRITSGTDARPGTTPWMTAISNSTNFICGGTLVHPRFVLTAAHCILENQQLLVSLGMYNMSCPEDKCPEILNYNVINAISHPHYNNLTNENDIAILKLHDQVVYNEWIRSICIVTGDGLNTSSIVNFSAYGWGKTEKQNLSSILQTINLSQKKTCLKFNGESQICAGAERGDTCEGDSGGPLVANITYLGYVFPSQIGITSFGSIHCNASGIYTNVTVFRQWIKRTILANDYDQDQERLLDENCSNTRRKHGSIHQPWKVNIRPSYAYGALLTKRFVVTIASYLPTNVQNIKVDAINGESFDVKSRHIKNNVALLRLNRDAQYSDLLAPICLLINPEQSNPTSLTAIIRSWHGTGDLEHQSLDVIDRSMCSFDQWIRNPVDNIRICVNDTSTNLVPNGELFGTVEKVGLDEKFFLHGIMDYRKNKILVLENIQTYKDWILNILNIDQ